MTHVLASTFSPVSMQVFVPFYLVRDFMVMNGDVVVANFTSLEAVKANFDVVVEAGIQEDEFGQPFYYIAGPNVTATPLPVEFLPLVVS